MHRKYLLTAAILVAFTSAGFAATHTHYWVAQDTKTKKCEIVTSKPNGKTWVEVGKDHYSSKTAAESALKGAKECEPTKAASKAKPKTEEKPKTS